MQPTSPFTADADIEWIIQSGILAPPLHSTLLIT